jgi:hypothetical protein
VFGVGSSYLAALFLGFVAEAGEQPVEVVAQTMTAGLARRDIEIIAVDKSIEKHTP